MKPTILLIILVCKACVADTTHRDPVISKPPNSKDTTINLKDTLGTISLSIPMKYDTFLSWTHFTDFSSGHIEKYRFQPKSLPINQESGWIWSSLKDSVEQLTISHYHHLRIADTTNKAFRMNHLKLLHEARTDPDMRNIIFDTVKEINNRTFSIIECENIDSTKKNYSRTIRANTILNGNILTLEYVIKTRNKDSLFVNFQRNSKLLLHQVHCNSL